jgi:hypothetical protein
MLQGAPITECFPAFYSCMPIKKQQIEKVVHETVGVGLAGGVARIQSAGVMGRYLFQVVIASRT